MSLNLKTENYKTFYANDIVSNLIAELEILRIGEFNIIDKPIMLKFLTKFLNIMLKLL